MEDLSKSEEAKNGNFISRREKLQYTKPSDNTSKKSRTPWQLYYASISVNLACLAAGAFQTWLSPAIPYLRSNATRLPHVIDLEQEGWIGSLAALGSAIGPIPAGLLADSIGRYYFMYVNAAIMMVSWILSTVATGKAGVAMIMASRLIGGIAVGAVYTVVPMYIGEISTPNLRATLGTLLQLFLCIGLLVPYCTGPWVSYNLLGIIGAFPVIVFLVFFYFCPETPNYLLSKHKHKQSEKSLKWLRGGVDVSNEINALEESIKKQPTKPYREQLYSIWNSRACRRGLEMGFALVAFQQFSGINAILLFGQSLFGDAGVDMSPAIATIIIGLTLTLSSVLASVLSLFFSSTQLLFVSSAGLIVTNAIMSIYFALMVYSDVRNFRWVPLVTMMIYIIVYCIGWGPLPWAVIGELFPQDVKGLASGMCATVCWLLGFLITRFFGTVNRNLGFHVTFGFFAACMLISAIYTFFRIPNTKGKTLQEIQDMLSN